MKQYIPAQMEVIELQDTDILTTSTEEEDIIPIGG